MPLCNGACSVEVVRAEGVGWNWIEGVFSGAGDAAADSRSRGGAYAEGECDPEQQGGLNTHLVPASPTLAVPVVEIPRTPEKRGIQSMRRGGRARKVRGRRPCG